MADGKDPPGPGDVHTDPNALPPRQEGGGLPSRREEVGDETYFSPREPSRGQDSSEELRRRLYGRHRSRRERDHRQSFSPARKGAAGEVSFPHHMVSSSPQQQSLDRSLTEEGLTSNIADLLSTLTGRVQLTPSD